MHRSTTTQPAQKESIWSVTAKMPVCRRLATDVDADVCIVGAGIAGLTTAYLLGKEGKSVVVLDDGGLASGMTQVTTAHLSSAIDDRFVNIEWWHGERGAQLAAESHAAAVSRIETIVGEMRIDCEFKRLDGYLLLGPGQEEELLERRARLDATASGSRSRRSFQGRSRLQKDRKARPSSTWWSRATRRKCYRASTTAPSR